MLQGSPCERLLVDLLLQCFSREEKISSYYNNSRQHNIGFPKERKKQGLGLIRSHSSAVDADMCASI